MAETGTTTKKAAAKQPKATAAAAPQEVDPRTASINKARSQAKSEVAEKYRTEVNARIAELVKADGFDWAPAPTAEEKAAAELEKIYAEFPHLRPAPVDTPAELT